jgi:polysaccharide export outer membrane protein
MWKRTLCIAAAFTASFANGQDLKPAGNPQFKGDLPCIPADPSQYSIGAGDVIAIKVLGEPDYTGQYVVRPDGKITIPRVGDIYAQNLTPDQLTGQVETALKTILKRPEVTTSLWQNNSKKYTLQGEVNRPGARPLSGPMTVFDALGEAGGFQQFANKSKILIIRADGSRLNFNWVDFIKGKHMEQNIPIQNGDTIVVN